MADELKILRAGAVKPGLTRVIDAFEQSNGTKVLHSFATAPAILQQIGSGAQADVVIAPASVLEELTKSGKYAVRETTLIGHIGIGVFVRNGQPLPQIGAVDDFKQSLLVAQTIVYNQASTGAYLAKLFESLGIAAAVQKKSTRYPDFAGVLDHIARGAGNEIGLGATTVIIESQSRGVKFAGPLPAEIQNYTSYYAAAIAQEERQEAAQQFARYFTSANAKSLLAAAGIDECGISEGH